jgi:hypothetical protein
VLGGDVDQRAIQEAQARTRSAVQRVVHWVHGALCMHVCSQRSLFALQIKKTGASFLLSRVPHLTGKVASTGLSSKSQ